MSELKPCPFCGGEAKIVKRSFYSNKESRLRSYRERVECKICGLTTREYKKPNGAVHRWNTRAAPDVTELVSVGNGVFANGIMVGFVSLDGVEFKLTTDTRERHPVVRRDQAAEIIAAERAWKEKAILEYNEIFKTAEGWKERAKVAEARLAAMEENK